MSGNTKYPGIAIPIMGDLRAPEKVKLIVGLISNNVALFEKAISALEREFRNSVDFESGILAFTHTDYYNEEMGLNLKRKFFSFAKTVPLKNIEKTKLFSNKAEKIFSLNGKRMINIDPGYLDLSKLVLFSTKDYSHRVHVGNGVFAEVTLYFKDGKYNPWPWTYPDYKTDEYAAIFKLVRDNYKDRKAH